MDARKEYSEANITLAVISGGDIPQPEDLGVEPSTYLNGLAEVIGELRRYILDSLRRESFDRCDELMEVMDENLRHPGDRGLPRGGHWRAAPQHRHDAGRPGAHPRRPDHGPAAA